MTDAHHTQTIDTTEPTNPVDQRHKQLDSISRRLTEVLATLEGSQVITRIIINADEEQSAQVARFISEVIGLAERQLNQVYGEVEAARLWRVKPVS